MPIHERSVQIIHRKRLLLTYAPLRTVAVVGAAAGALIWALPLLVLLANFGYLYVTHWLSGQLQLLYFSSDPLWQRYVEAGWPWLIPAMAVGSLHATAYRHTLRTGRTVHVPIPLVGGRMGLEGVVSRAVIWLVCVALLLSGAGTLLILLVAGLSIRIRQAPDAFGQLITLVYDTLLFIYGERSTRESVRLALLEPLIKDDLIAWVIDVHFTDQCRTATLILRPSCTPTTERAIQRVLDNAKALWQDMGVPAPVIHIAKARAKTAEPSGRTATKGD